MVRARSAPDTQLHTLMGEDYIPESDAYGEEKMGDAAAQQQAGKGEGVREVGWGEGEGAKLPGERKTADETDNKVEGYREGARAPEGENEEDESQEGIVLGGEGRKGNGSAAPMPSSGGVVASKETPAEPARDLNKFVSPADVAGSGGPQRPGVFVCAREVCCVGPVCVVCVCVCVRRQEDGSAAPMPGSGGVAATRDAPAEPARDLNKFVSPAAVADSDGAQRPGVYTRVKLCCV